MYDKSYHVRPGRHLGQSEKLKSLSYAIAVQRLKQGDGAMRFKDKVAVITGSDNGIGRVTMTCLGTG